MKKWRVVIEYEIIGPNREDIDKVVRFVLLSSKDQLKVRKSHINSIAQIYESTKK